MIRQQARAGSEWPAVTPNQLSWAVQLRSAVQLSLAVQLISAVQLSLAAQLSLTVQLRSVPIRAVQGEAKHYAMHARPLP